MTTRTLGSPANRSKDSVSASPIAWSKYIRFSLPSVMTAIPLVTFVVRTSSFMDLLLLEISSRRLSFYRARRTPQNSWVYSVRIEGEHLVIELQRRTRARRGALKILNVMPGLIKDCRRILAARPLRPRNHSFSLKRSHRLDRRNPLLTLVRIGFPQVEMDIVICGVARNNQPNGRDMQTSCIVRVGMAEWNSY